MWCWHGCLRPQCSTFGHWCFCGGASTPKHLAKESRCAADSHGLCSLYVKQISDVWIIRQLQTPGISLTTLHHSLLGYFVFIVLISSCKHHLNSLRWPASAHGHCCWFVSCILCKRETCTSHHTYVIHYVGGCYCWGTAMRSFCLKVFIFIKSLNFFFNECSKCAWSNPFGEAMHCQVRMKTLQSKPNWVLNWEKHVLYLPIPIWNQAEKFWITWSNNSAPTTK